MLNKCCFIGNLGRDPEVRALSDGKQVVNFSLAVTEKWKNKSGESQESTEWVKIVIFNEHIGKIAAQYLTKGSKVYIEGQIKTRKWTDKDGHEKYSTEIVLQNFGGQLILLGGKPSGVSSAGTAELDDSIPF